jgi:hypothetical protein
VGLSMVHAPAGSAVTQKWLNEGNWEVDIAGRIYPATVSLKPMYDPTNSKIKV